MGDSILLPTQPSCVLMELGPLATLSFGLAGVFSAPFLKNVFDMRKERNYREMAGSLVWPASFFICATIAVATEAEMPTRVQNILLGSFGALLGGSIFVWGGYFVRDNWGAKAQSASATAVHSMPVSRDPAAQGDKHLGGAAIRIGPTGGIDGLLFHGNTVRGGPAIVNEGTLKNVDMQNNDINPAPLKKPD